MKFAEFYPSEPTDGNDLLVMGPILGGCLEATDGTPGDHAYRAQVIAQELGINVLAYSGIDEDYISAKQPKIFILGMPTAYEPGEHARVVAANARQLQSEIDKRAVGKIQAFGVSLEGGHTLGMVKSELFEPQRITLYDPTQTVDRTKTQHLGIPLPAVVSKLGGFTRWGIHQANARLLHGRASRNQHPMEHMGPSPVNPIAQLALLSNALINDDGLRTLEQIATGELCPGAKTTLFLPGHTYTGSLKSHLQTATNLNALAKQHEVRLHVQVNPNQWHASTDDPYVCAELLRSTLGER